MANSHVVSGLLDKHAEISARLEAMGIHESPQNISNKIGRGTFGAIFMIQVLDAIGCKTLQL